MLFTVILGEHTVAESTCPTTGEQIRLELTPEAVTSVRPSKAVVSQRHRKELVADLRSDVCDHGHFFSSPNAATDWLASHPDGQVLSIAEAFAECRAACEQLGWLTPEVAGP
ncbi:MAG: hypothetical protein J2P58_05975 [Acidimicrobiaceae bacterium]|nr:hypothetical protein [Acidimicrobiaceae bacterium]